MLKISRIIGNAVPYYQAVTQSGGIFRNLSNIWELNVWHGSEYTFKRNMNKYFNLYSISHANIANSKKIDLSFSLVGGFLCTVGKRETADAES